MEIYDGKQEKKKEESSIVKDPNPKTDANQIRMQSSNGFSRSNGFQKLTNKTEIAVRQKVTAFKKVKGFIK